MIHAPDLRMLARANRQAKERERATYARLLAAVWQAADEGWKQVDMTRERVRQILDDEYRAKHAPSRQPPPGQPG